jgi:hypothetical protein
MCGSDGISESSIDLNGDSHALKVRRERHAHAFVVSILGNALGFDRISVEG